MGVSAASALPSGQQQRTARDKDRGGGEGHAGGAQSGAGEFVGEGEAGGAAGRGGAGSGGGVGGVRAGAVVELQVGLRGRQLVPVVDEHDDRVDVSAGPGGGVGEVQIPDAVAAARFIGVGAAVDAGGEGEAAVVGGGAGGACLSD